MAYYEENSFETYGCIRILLQEWFHKFAKIYKKNFRIKVNALLMENIPKVLLTYENDVELFKEYLKIFGDSLQLNEYGDTLLHQAAE